MEAKKYQGFKDWMIAKDYYTDIWERWGGWEVFIGEKRILIYFNRNED